MSARFLNRDNKSIPRQQLLLRQVARLSLLPAISSWLPVAVAAEAPELVRPTRKSTTIAQIVADRQFDQPQLFVNPAMGNDITGNGSITTPLKTITQALKIAQPNTIIQLAPGTYSDRTGEVFPLRLQPQVTILGNPSTQGENIIIIGGGNYLSPTFARQNIAILGANNATIAGVTVTNPLPRGYGLWIESSSPTVTDNTFRDSSHDGISIVGKGTPLIRRNYFLENQANGITIYGKSRPQVRDNIFYNTGFGLNIAQNSAPTLIGNRITHNKDGIVVQGNALPVLRENRIESNTRYGLVAIANAQPNLGTAKQPGGNIFRHNRELDINAQAASRIFPAFGNHLTPFHTQGDIDFQGVVSLVTPPPQIVDRPTITSASSNNSSRPTITSASSSNSSRPTITSASSNNSSRPTITSASSGNSGNSSSPTITSFPSPSNYNSPTVSSPTASYHTEVIQIPVPPPQSTLPSQTATFKHQIPTVSSEVPSLGPLPAAGLNVSPNNTSRLDSVQVSVNPGWRSATTPAPPARTGGSDLRYRVVVDTTNSWEQNKLRQIVPDAFRSFSNGRAIVQAGAFASLNEAKERLQLLTSQGFRATIEDY